MGSTSVSSIGNILLQGRSGSTQTAADQDELKVQFAEVISQMTTQVGGNSSTNSLKSDATQTQGM